MYALLFAVFFLVHSPGGNEIAVNSSEVSSIRQPHEPGVADTYADQVHCVLVMTNGAAIGTAETCREVIGIMAAADRNQQLLQQQQQK